MDRLLLDKYEIVRVLGHGGMGTVYEARDVGSGRRVAIKWMHSRPFSDDDPELRRFEQEARIAGTLSCPNVTAVFDLAREPEKGVVFQVMELHEGEDLRTLLERVGPLAPDTALRIAAQASAGLSAAHAAGVVHRDIKPENLFLARKEDGEVVVKLLDFGIAKIRRTPENASQAGGMTAPAVPMTTSGQVLGTPLYMAPEQIDSAKNVDERSDVYSMGVALYAMLSGKPPHAEIKSLMRLLHAIACEPPPPLAEQAPWVPAEVVAIVERATSYDKQARYENGAALAAAIGSLLKEGAGLREEMLVGIGAEEKKREVAPRQAPTLRKENEAEAGIDEAGARRGVVWVVTIGFLVVLVLLGALTFAR